MPIEQFWNAPLDVPDAKYISKTDVTSYYEFVDHDLLSAELIAQTGEELAADVLADLLVQRPAVQAERKVAAGEDPGSGGLWSVGANNCSP